MATDDHLLLRVQASDAVANLVTGLEPGEAAAPDLTLPAFEVLGIGEPELTELRASVEAELLEARDLIR